MSNGVATNTRSSCGPRYGRDRQRATTGNWAILPAEQGGIHGEVPANNVVSFNTVRSEDAQRRIRETVKRLEAEGQLPLTATARMRAIVQQGVSSKTLYRHLDLWHPIHYQTDHSELCKTSDVESISGIFDGGFAKIAESPKIL